MAPVNNDPLSTMITLHQQQQNGIEAQRIIDNEVFANAMRDLKSQIVSQWKDCPVRDKEGALLLLQLAKLADKFESILTGYIEGGKFAARQINIDKERDEGPVRRYLRRAQ